MRALTLFALVLATSAVHAHRLPNTFVTGQRLVDQFDPTIRPKVLYAPDGTFVAKLPSGGWETDAERVRHIRSIDAENGRWYIHAVFDAGRGKAFCFREHERPDDETFYEDLIRELRAFPREQLQRRSAADLISEIWRRKWPCSTAQRRPQ
jgi:hypothetical protein